MKKVYAIYKGEECLGIGTVKELADQLNVKIRTIYFYTTPTYKKRCNNSQKRRIIIEI